MRRALVTGATGYIGSQLVGTLIAADWDVHVIVRSSALRESIRPYIGHIVIHQHDGTIGGMLELINESSPHIVFHLAAMTQSEHCPEDIESLVNTNILFSTQLLEAMSVNGIRNLVNTETFWQHCNGSKDYAPSSLYAATKQAFHDIIEYYVNAGFINAISLMLYDTYGRNDPRKKIFPLLKQAAIDKKCIYLSPGDQVIDLTHVDDVVAAYLRASEILSSERKCQSKVYSVSSGERMSLKALVKIIESETNIRFQCVWGGRPYRRNEVMSPWLGYTLPGWTPRQRIIEWIKQEFVHSDV
jgi:nucleoside-diphosphate-sugar epimerase